MITRVLLQFHVCAGYPGLMRSAATLLLLVGCGSEAFRHPPPERDPAVEIAVLRTRLETTASFDGRMVRVSFIEPTTGEDPSFMARRWLRAFRSVMDPAWGGRIDLAKDVTTADWSILIAEQRYADAPVPGGGITIAARRGLVAFDARFLISPPDTRQ